MVATPMDTDTKPEPAKVELPQNRFALELEFGTSL